MSQVDPAQARFTNLVVWVVLLASQLIYVAILLSGVRTNPEPMDLPALPVALGVVALVTGLGSHLSWRRATGASRALHQDSPDPGTSFTFYMLAWTLDESIAVYGLLLGLLAFSPFVWALFSLAAFILLLSHRPS